MCDKRDRCDSPITSSVGFCLSRRYLEVRAVAQFPPREILRPAGGNSADILPTGHLGDNQREACRLQVSILKPQKAGGIKL